MSSCQPNELNRDYWSLKEQGRFIYQDICEIIHCYYDFKMMATYSHKTTLLTADWRRCQYNVFAIHNFPIWNVSFVLIDVFMSFCYSLETISLVTEAWNYWIANDNLILPLKLTTNLQQLYPGLVTWQLAKVILWYISSW